MGPRKKQMLEQNCPLFYPPRLHTSFLPCLRNWKVRSLPISPPPHVPSSPSARQKELGISSYGVSVTTMEEVFFKVGEGVEIDTAPSADGHPLQTSAPPSYTQAAPPHPHHVIPPRDLSFVASNVDDVEQQTLFHDTDPIVLPDEVPRPHIIDVATYHTNTGMVLWFQQFYAILLKRFYNTIRFWGSLITQLFLPCVMVLLALILTKTTSDTNSDSPLRPLTIPNSAVSSNASFFYASLGGDAGINFSVSNLPYAV